MRGTERAGDREIWVRGGRRGKYDRRRVGGRGRRKADERKRKGHKTKLYDKCGAPRADERGTRPRMSRIHI